MIWTKIDASPEIVAIGDNPIRKEAEKLAALAAVYELHGRGMVCGLCFQTLDIIHFPWIAWEYQ